MGEGEVPEYEAIRRVRRCIQDGYGRQELHGRRRTKPGGHFVLWHLAGVYPSQMPESAGLLDRLRPPGVVGADDRHCAKGLLIISSCIPQEGSTHHQRPSTHWHSLALSGLRGYSSGVSLATTKATDFSTQSKAAVRSPPGSKEFS